METVDSVGDSLDDSGINSTIDMESKDQNPEKIIDIELAKQLGMMTMKNIMQENQGQVIPLQDLCNQFATKAEKKEKEAVGQEVAEVLVTMKEFPDIFVILEGDMDRLDEGEVSVQLVDEPGIPSLLSGVLKIKGILRDKGKLNVRDLSGIFNESCTLGENEAVGGNSEILKETLSALPGVFHVTGEMVSMDVNTEPDENSSKGYADIEKQSSIMEQEVEDVKVSALSGKMEGTQSNIADNTAEEVIYKGDEEMEDQPSVKLGGQQNHQQPETNDELEQTQSDTIEDEVEKPSDESGDQDHQPPERNDEFEQTQSNASEDEVEKPSDESGDQDHQPPERNDEFEQTQSDTSEDEVDKSSDESDAVNENEPQQQQDNLEEMSSEHKECDVDDQETPSNIKVGEVKEQSDEIDEEDIKYQQESSMEDHLHQSNSIECDTQEVSDVEKQVDSQKSSSCTSSSLNDDSISQVSVSSASATAVEQNVDIPAMLAKQLGIMKIKQILTEKGSISLQVLSSAFGSKGTAEERDAVGRKACEISQTLQQFNDVFAFERFPEKGGTLYEQEYVSLKGGDNEISLAFARAVLKIPDILEERGNLTVTQLSTFVNQNSTLDERTAVGRNPVSLKETLSALPRLFHFSDEKVYVMKAKQSTKKVEAELQTQAASATAEATNFANHFDCTFVYQHLGVLMLREIVEERGEMSLQLLCSYFGQRADDNEREAVGWRAMVVLETLKEYPDIFNIKLPKNVTVQSVVNETKVSLKGSAANKTPVPYARAMFKLIWFLKEKGTLSVIHLSTCLGQNSTLSEREAVGKNPGTLKKTLKTFPKMFEVSGDNISVVEDAHTYAASQFVHHKKKKVPEPEYQLSISEQLRKKIVSTVIECLQSKNGSCDLDFITRRIRSHGSSKEKEIFGNNGKALMKLLKTMPAKFSFQGSHVYLVNSKDNGRNGASGYGIPKYEATRALFPEAGNPIPIQGVLPKSQAKVIPSIEIMFDTKNRCENGWRDLSVSRALTTSSQTQYQAPASFTWPLMSPNQQQLSSGLTTTEKIEQFYSKRSVHKIEPSQSAQQAIGGLQSTSISMKTSHQPTQAKQSGLEKITAYLEQCKITTIIQLGGVLGSKGTAAERNAVGKNPGLLYDTLSSLPDKFVIVGPFVGVKSQSALVNGIAKLVTFVESKGKCEVTYLMGRLGHNGTTEEQIAIGQDIQTFIQTISAMPGVFVIDGTSVYLNGTNGQPHSPTKMDKTTAINQKVGWTLSAGTSVLNSSPSVLASENGQMALPSFSTAKSDSYASAVTASLDKQDAETPSFTLTVVAITDQAMCQEFVQQCLAKYDYPIISLVVNKEKKWIAIAGWEEQVYLFDMEGATASAGGFSVLAEVIASDKVLKVVLNCKYVSTVLHECYGFKLNNIFDTKVAFQLLTGESAVSVPQLCNKYGVISPDKWKIIISSGSGAAAGTASRSLDQKDQRLAAWARVLIPQIYQHMVMKFSEDSLKEVGKLCESFLCKEDGSASSGLSAASVNNIATPVQSPSITSSGYVDISSSSRSSDILPQANLSFGQKELASFGATHSKVCNYLKQRGPTPISRLYHMLHRTGDLAGVDDNLAMFQRSLLAVSTRYILLESGLVELVEHVQNSAVVKILGILEEKGVIGIGQLLCYFKKVATADEVKVVARTKHAFKKMLELIDLVYVLKNGNVCLCSKLKEQAVDKMVQCIKQSGTIHIDRLIDWFRKEASYEELLVGGKTADGIQDILKGAGHILTVQGSHVSLNAGAAVEEDSEPVASQLPSDSQSPGISALAKVYKYLEDNGPTPIQQLFKEIQGIASTPEQHALGMNASELMTTLETCSHPVFVIWPSLIVDIHEERKIAIDEAIAFIERTQPCSLTQFSLWVRQFIEKNPQSCITLDTMKGMQNIFMFRDEEVSLQPGVVSTTKTEVASAEKSKEPESHRTTSDEEDVTTSKSHCSDIVQSSIPDQSPVGARFLGSSGYLKTKFVEPLMCYVDQNGPTSLIQLQSLLKSNIGAENVPSIGDLEEHLRHHRTKFTILASGLVGPNETKLCAVEKIATILERKGKANITAVRRWFYQNSTEEEKNSLGTTMQTFKKKLKQFPHIFQVDQSSVSLQTGYIPKGDQVTSTFDTATNSIDSTNSNDNMDPSSQESTSYMISSDEDNVMTPPRLSELYDSPRHALKTHSCISTIPDETEPEQACASPEKPNSIGTEEPDVTSKQKPFTSGGYLKTKHIKALRSHINKNGPTALAELHSVLQNLIGGEYNVSIKEFKRILKRRPCQNIFTISQGGLVGLHQGRNLAVRKIVTFLEREGTSDITSICSWFNRHGSQKEKTGFGTTEETLKKKMSSLRGIFQFHIEENTECISLQPNYLLMLSMEEMSNSAAETSHKVSVSGASPHMKVTGSGSGSKQVVTCPENAQSKMSEAPGNKQVSTEEKGSQSRFLKQKYLASLWKYIEEHGPTTLKECQSILEREMDCEYEYPMEELIVSLKSYFVILPSGLVGLNETRHCAVLKIVEFLKETGTSNMEAIWSWFNKHASSEDKIYMGETKKALRKRLKLFPHIFLLTEFSVFLQFGYLCKEQHSAIPTALGENKNSSGNSVPTSAGGNHSDLGLADNSSLGSASGNLLPIRSSSVKVMANTELNSVWNEGNQHQYVQRSESQTSIPSTSNSNTALPCVSECDASSFICTPYTLTGASLQPHQDLREGGHHEEAEADAFVLTHNVEEAVPASNSNEVTPPTLNPWEITQQLRDQFAYRNKHDMNKLMAILGEDITRNLTRLAESSGKDGLNMLTDITLDCGRFAQARFYQRDCPSGSIEVNVSSTPITQENIQSVLDCDWVTTPTPDRRAGIEDTLHRLGIITNRNGRAIGLTACVGRAVLGSADHIHDLMQDGQSMVLMGSPGVGMTTVLREIGRVLSDVKKRRVVIIDTYNQIGGDSDTPHTSIGSARRLQVASRTDQYKTMVEALQNHNPQTVIIDEIGTAPEAQAVRNLVQRGVQVIASAHSCNFVDFLQNPEFKAITGMVPGGVGNEGMDLGNGSKATVLERRQEPAFKVLIELCDRDRWLVYKDLSLYIDYYLQGILHPIVQERQRTWHYSEQGIPSGSQCTVKLVEVSLPLPSPLTV